MKKLILTRAFKINEMSNISHPLIKEYANKCNADFLVLNERKIDIGPFHNEIFQCHDLLDKYDRICIIDSDVLISNNAPDIFKIVPEDSVGVVYEDVGYRKKNRLKLIKEIQQINGNVGWSKGYINTGFIVVSKSHQVIFDIGENGLWNKEGYDDVQLGFNIHKHNIKIFQLPYKFNHMSLFSELGFNWLKSFVIHYAGTGFYRRMPREQQMMRDLSLINNKSLFQLNFSNSISRIRLIVMGVIGYFKA
jgi:hypothetical protein